MTKFCIDCGEQFSLYSSKPGKINQCTDCGVKSEVELLGGNMVFFHKTAPEIEIKTLSQAQRFAAQTVRVGHGINRGFMDLKSMNPYNN